MKLMIMILIFCLIILNLYAGLGVHTTDPSMEIQNEIIQKLSDRSTLSNKKNIHDWCKYQLCIELLLYRHITPDLAMEIGERGITENNTEMVLDQCILSDPNNKLAWFMKAESVCDEYCAEYKCLGDDMQLTIKNSKKENKDKLLIPSVSILYPILMKYEHPEYLKKTKEGRYLIFPGNFELDYDKATKLLKDYLDNRYLSVHKTILEAQKQDPDNACYHYLLAGLYLTCGLEQDAIKQLLFAEQKNANMYNDERQRLVMKLVNDLSLSEETKKLCLLGKEMPFEGWCEMHWGRDYMRLIDKYEKQGDLAKAKEYCDLGIRLLNKIPESEWLCPSDGLKKKYLKKSETLNIVDTKQ